MNGTALKVPSDILPTWTSFSEVGSVRSECLAVLNGRTPVSSHTSLPLLQGHRHTDVLCSDPECGGDMLEP